MSGARGFLLGLGLLFGVLGASRDAKAEPWLSTRFAQNCAACHGPGRKNLEASERRCTLSCQGCHTNPNGGGLRTFYGKWNEDRWLRSFRTDQLRHASSFAPMEKQAYGVRPFGERVAKESKDAKDAKDAKDGKEPKKARKGKGKGPGRDGFKLVEITNTDPPEDRYKRDGLEFKVSESKAEFLYQVPEGDPYRIMDQTKTNAGGDIRWQWVRFRSTTPDGKGGKNTSKRWSNFLMDADFNMEWRPLYKYLHLVYEARIQGTPADTARYEDFLLKAGTRSMYAMVDNLPYNAFAMAGYYRPLFGNYVPDHYALAQLMTTFAMTKQAKNYNILFNSVTVGTAPNVPYLNLHLIGKQMGDNADNTNGLAANAGLRFVSYGASINYSYWRTTDKRAHGGPVTGVEMHSLGGAGKLGRTVAALDFVSLKRDVDTQDFRRGAVWTVDTYTQVWREQYGTFNVARSNTTTDLKPGDASQVKAGVRSFWIPGFETMVVLAYMNENAADPKTKARTAAKTVGLEGQFHMFF